MIPTDDGRPTVYSIPFGTPFVDSLAAGLMADLDSDTAALTDMLVLLPTRRACRALRDAFLRLNQGEAMLLPRMVPLGDVDEDELALTGEGILGGDADLDLAAAIRPVRRQLLLARAVQAFDAKSAGFDQALGLAGELARLLDQVQTEGLSFDGLENLVSADYAVHWQTTLAFLRILTDNWPAILDAEGAVDPAWRRARLLAAQARLWADAPPRGPVIAAGSTGSVPATADLMKVIAGLPRGCVVLPGFDAGLGETTRVALGPGHPQYGMHRLLSHLDVTPAAVRTWPGVAVAQDTETRGALMRAAFWPPVATRAPAVPDPGETGFPGLHRIDCPGPVEEAGTIALMLRRCLETPCQTAALVTPDRRLARRVAADLRRWGIEIDDSAGVPLGTTPPGSFLRLCARMVLSDFAPLDLLAACKHPLAAGGIDRGDFLALARRLERRVLRGPRPAPGLAVLRRMLEPDDPAQQLLSILEQTTAPLRLAATGAPSLSDLVQTHVVCAEGLAGSAAKSGATRLWRGDAGEAAAAFVADLLAAGNDLNGLEARHYPAVLDALMAGQPVRPRFGGHPRLQIWGLLEARLQTADMVILGGLNEGTWPPDTPASPWMSRPMMARFGLALPERRIGLTAHDFVQACGAPVVYLTRVDRTEGTPTVPARWLRRIDNTLAAMGRPDGLAGDRQYLYWQGLLDRPGAVSPLAAPAPKPPVAARPRDMSVTQVEVWMRDPYAIYSRKILKLVALEPLDADPAAADYGTLIHDTLDRFTAAYPGPLAADARDQLLAIGRATFGNFMERPGVRAFWWPRFVRIADWFIETETARRTEIVATATEVSGDLVLAGPHGPFRLKAKADRIDRLADNSLWVIDYKTGAVPTNPEIHAGFAPQLPLEAAIARAGGFDGLAAAPVSGLEFWRLRGIEPAGKRHPVKGEPGDLADAALDGLKGLIRVFDDPETPYEAQPSPKHALRYSDYNHLARVKEWATGDGGDDG